MPNMGCVHGEVVGSHDGYGQYLDDCRNAGKPVNAVKTVRDGGMLMEAMGKGVSYRLWRGMVKYPGDNDDQDNPNGDFEWPYDQAATIANEWMTLLYELWLPDRGVTTHLEITNEANIANVHQATAQNLFYIECMKWADNPPTGVAPFKIAICSFSAGCPEEWAIEILAPAFDYAATHGHLVAMHDGALFPGQTMRQAAGENLDGNGIALRYRMFNRVLDRLGYHRPQYIVTEGYREGGYKGMNEDQWADLIWYLKELSRDGVLGWCWFTLGDYSFDGMSAKIARAAKTSSDLRRAVSMYASSVSMTAAGSVNIVSQIAPDSHGTGKYTRHLIDVDWPEPEAPPPPSSNTLDLGIVFMSQNNPTSANLSPNDCGAACLAMLLNTKGVSCTVNEVWQASGASTGYMTFDDLEQAANAYGYTLERRYNQTLDSLRAAMRNGEFCIMLVNATYLWQPGKNPPYVGAHFVVPDAIIEDGTVDIHDPNNLAYVPQENLSEAWGNCHLQGNSDNAMLVLKPWSPHPPPPPPSSTLSGVGLAETRALTANEVEAIRISKIKAVKVLTIQDPPENVALIEQIRAINPNMLIMARLMCPFNPGDAVTPQEFVNYCAGPALTLYSLGVRLFEIHNEPNLTSEGMGVSWSSGAEFSEWFQDVYLLLRSMMPYAQLGFPGLSPQEHDQAGICQASDSFLEQAAEGVEFADFLCCHSYWQNRGTGHWQMSSEDFGGWYYRRAQRRFPYRPLYITEYSCNNPNVSDAEKGRMYPDYVANLPGVVAAFSFCLSWDNDPNHEGWVRNGQITDIPRQF